MVPVNVPRLPLAVRLRRLDGDVDRVWTWALTTSWRARSTSVTADSGWSPVDARASWSASSSTVVDRAAARFDFAASCKSTSRYNRIRHDTIRNAILTRARKLTQASWTYTARNQITSQSISQFLKSENRIEEKIKIKSDMLKSNGNCP